MVRNADGTDEEAITVKTDPVHVLLVDDDEQWAEFVAGDLERAAEELSVTVAVSANEALLALSERDVDCVVADYRMPEVDGLQLLERVREDRPDLPFVLVTGQGSEDVAARAIDAGVTDYLVKDPRADRTVQFVTKIRRAVEQHRLRRAIEESEERYRTVTEQSRDAIGILQDGRVRFCNRRVLELTGRDREELRGCDVVEAVVHPEDRDAVREVIDGWDDEDGDDESLHSLRIVRPDGTVRHCEYTGRSIAYEGDPATLVSIRDVTERKQRERELEWARELDRTVQEALVESRTREDLERAIVDALRDQGYSLAWVAEWGDESLAPRAVGGDADYLDAIDLTTEGGENASEPTVWAARTGEPQFLQDFEDLFPTGWRDRALDRGFRSGAAIPLVYNDVSYGLLAAYHARPDRFDGTERRLLTDLADTVAFAVHSLETESALAADRTVEATVLVADDTYYLVDLAGDGAFLDCNRVSVRGTIPTDDAGVLQYVTLDGDSTAQVREALTGHPDVHDVDVVAADGPTQLQAVVSGAVPESHLATRGVVVRSTTVDADGAAIEVELPGRKSVRPAVDALEATFEGVSVLAVTAREDSGAADGTERDFGRDGADLTEKQAQALQAAYYQGYFEQPRRRSASEVAESLGVTHSTFLHHLRVAQRKVFEVQFD